MITTEEKGGMVVAVSNRGSMEGSSRIFENKVVQVEKMSVGNNCLGKSSFDLCSSL